jgi:hypothetical protein
MSDIPDLFGILESTRWPAAPMGAHDRRTGFRAGWIMSITVARVYLCVSYMRCSGKVATYMATLHCPRTSKRTIGRTEIVCPLVDYWPVHEHGAARNVHRASAFTCIRM